MAGNTIRFSAFLDDKVSAPLAKIRGQFDTLGKSKGYRSFTQGLGVGAGVSAFNLLGQAVSGAFDLVGDSIQKASALGESVSKSNVIFGQSAKQVEAWGGTLARSFGISKQAGIEAAASFGNIFVGLDLGEQKAAEMSKTLVELAGDLASFNNLDTADALEKLRAGLAGEAEPLRALGVFLSEAKVKAKAFELGLVGAHGEVSESAKVTARYNLILEETTTAQGDAARTADSFANSQRRLAAINEDLAASWGEKLTPVAEGWNRFMIELISQVTKSENAQRAIRGELDLTTTSMDEQRRVLEELAAAGYTLEGPFGANIRLVNDSVNAFDRLNAQMDRGKDGLKGVSTVTQGRAVPAFSDLNREVSASARSFRDLTGDAKTWSSWVYDEVRGQGDLQDELRQTNGRLKDARRHLKELEAIEHPTREQRRDMADTRVEINGLESDAFDLNAQLSALGSKPAKDGLRPYLDSLHKKLRDGLITANEYREALDALGIRSTAPRGGSGKDSRNRKRRASGGSVGDTGVYDVGERGPERLIMFPGGGGYVQPAAGGRNEGGGGAPVVVQLNLDGEAVARVVDRRLFYDLRRAAPTSLRS